MHLFDEGVKFFFNFFSPRKLLAIKALRAGGARKSLISMCLRGSSRGQKEGARQPLRAPQPPP